MTGERLEWVTKLIGFEGDIEETIQKLNTFEWDYTGDPIVLRKEDAASVLERYIDGQITSGDIEKWADAIELREDIAYEPSSFEWLENVICTLSAPEINGLIDAKQIHALLEQRPL